MIEVGDIFQTDTVAIEDLNKPEVGFKDKFSKVLPGWDVRSVKPEDPFLVNCLRWAMTKQLENGDNAAIIVDTYTHKEGHFNFHGNVVFSKKDVTFNMAGITRVEFDSAAKRLIFNGGNGSYEIANGKEHELKSRDGMIAVKTTTT